MESHDLSAFTYNDTRTGEILELSESWRDEHGTPWFTRRAIGEFLEYADPQKSIDNILERHPYINEYSVPLRLPGRDGKMYEHKVISPIGFHLIVMESETEKAKQAKIAVAHFIEDFRTGRFALHGLHKLANDIMDEMTLEQLGHVLEQSEYAFVGALVNDAHHTAYKALRMLRLTLDRPSFADKAAALHVSPERLERVLSGDFNDDDSRRAMGWPVGLHGAFGKIKAAGKKVFGLRGPDDGPPDKFLS